MEKKQREIEKIVDIILQSSKRDNFDYLSFACEAALNRIGVQISYDILNLTLDYAFLSCEHEACERINMKSSLNFLRELMQLSEAGILPPEKEFNGQSEN